MDTNYKKERLLRRFKIWKKTETKVVIRWQEKFDVDSYYNRVGEGAKFKNGWKWHQKTLPRCNKAIQNWLHAEKIKQGVDIGEK